MLSNQLTIPAPPEGHIDVNMTSFHAGSCCFNNSSGCIACSKNSWIIDFGATRHICATKSLFLSLKPLHNSTVTLPNHTVIPVFSYGDIMLNENLMLKNVLLVPDFKFNLILVSYLTLGSSIHVNFSDDNCEL